MTNVTFSRRSHELDITNSVFVSEIKWYILLASLLSITFFLQVAAKHQMLPISNYFIYDSYTYEIRVLFDRNLGTFADSFTSINGALYQLGPYTFFIVNSILLFLSIKLCNIFYCISPNSVLLARFVVATNPYLLIGAIGPNKETVLLFISLLSLKLFFHRHSFVSFLGVLVAVSAIFVRPVFGSVLLFAFILSPFIRLFKNPINLFLLILAFYFIANSTPYVNEILNEAQGEELASYQGSNLYEIALFLKILNQHPILQFLSFSIKVVLIFITPIARPNPFFSIPVPILDLGYSYMAYLLLPFNIAFLLLIYNKTNAHCKRINAETQLLILYALMGLLTVVVNGNITFRYIFPYTPILVAFFNLHSLKTRNKILILSLVMVAMTFVSTAFFLRKYLEVDISLKPQFTSWF